MFTTGVPIRLFRHVAFSLNYFGWATNLNSCSPGPTPGLSESPVYTFAGALNIENFPDDTSQQEALQRVKQSVSPTRVQMERNSMSFFRVVA